MGTEVAGSVQEAVIGLLVLVACLWVGMWCLVGLIHELVS